MLTAVVKASLVDELGVGLVDNWRQTPDGVVNARQARVLVWAWDDKEAVCSQLAGDGTAGVLRLPLECFSLNFVRGASHVRDPFMAACRSARARAKGPRVVAETDRESPSGGSGSPAPQHGVEGV